MRNLFQKLQTSVFGPEKHSKDEAKNRLKVLLIHDQVALTQAQMESMKEEIMQVIQKYCEVEVDGVDFRLSREDGSISLVSNVPVRKVTARAS